MYSAVVTGALLCCFAAQSANSTPTPDIKNALDAILGGNFTSGGGVVVLPPALSIDIISLLRWAMTKEDLGADMSNARKANMDARNSSFFPKNKLDLVQFNGKDYFFCKNEKMTWLEAVTFCRLYGMELVSVETEQENNFIVEKIKQYGGMNGLVWTSGNKIGRSTYLWLNGEDLIYQNWGPKQPIHVATENCLIYHHGNTPVFQWYDLPCFPDSAHSNVVQFICEDP